MVPRFSSSVIVFRFASTSPVPMHQTIIWIAHCTLLNWQQRQQPWAGEGTASRLRRRSPTLAITSLPGLHVTACSPCHQTQARREPVGHLDIVCCAVLFKEKLYLPHKKKWKASEETSQIPFHIAKVSSVCSSYRWITQWIPFLCTKLCGVIAGAIPFFLCNLKSLFSNAVTFFKQTVAIY